MGISCFRPAGFARTLLLAAVLAGVGAAQASAFDLAGYRARLDATLAEVKGKPPADAGAWLARLDEMIAIGKAGAQEYAARAPQFAKLMTLAIDDATAMRTLTDGEIEDKWGESGSAGDAVGIPLKTLGQFDETRAHLELIVGPSHTYIYLKKWQATHKRAQLDKAADELGELSEHLNQVK